jgi:hypothetical protein
MLTQMLSDMPIFYFGSWAKYQLTFLEIQAPVPIAYSLYLVAISPPQHQTSFPDPEKRQLTHHSLP